MARPVRSLLLVVIALALLAPAIAAGRAIADDWMPISDNAAIALDAHDVFSTQSPLVGVRTQLGGEEYDGRARHLGPLEAWVLAVPERVAGSQPWGIVVGVALVAIASLVAIGWACARVGGVATAAWALALTAVACWSLGRQVLADPWNPHIAVLPLAAALFLAWAATSGEPWALPGLALAASFAAQGHLLYAPLSVVLFVGTAVTVIATRPAVRELVVTAGVLVVAWLFPLWEQLTHRPGNIVEVARALRDDPEVAVGWSFSFRTMARAIGGIPLFAQPARDLGNFNESLSPVVALLAVLIVGGLVVATVFAIRRRDRVVAAATIVALVSLTVTTVTTAQVPRGFPDVALYRLLILWPVGVFTWFALGFAVARLVSLPVVARRIGAVAAVVLLAVAAPAAGFADSALPEDARHMDAVRTLARASDEELESVGPVGVEVRGELTLQLRYGLVRELRRLGVDARVDPDDLYLHGKYEAPDGAARLIVVGADNGTPPTDDAQLLATFQGWDGRDLERLAELEGRLQEVFDNSGVAEIQGRPPHEVIEDEAFLRLLADGTLSLSEAESELVSEYRRQYFDVAQLTLAAYLIPAR